MEFSLLMRAIFLLLMRERHARRDKRRMSHWS